MKGKVTDAEVVGALRVLVRWLVEEAGSAEIDRFVDRRALRVFTQRNLPPGCPSVGVFKSRHRQLRKKGARGVWSDGKTLCITSEAWDEHVSLKKAPLAGAQPAPQADAPRTKAEMLDEQVMQELGLKRVRR